MASFRICTLKSLPYRVFGYGRKQVRDNIHSHDLVNAFAAFIQAPRAGEVYNIGGSRHCNCSMLEAIHLYEQMSGRKLNWNYEEANRIGDQIWWISDVQKFKDHFLIGSLSTAYEKSSKKFTPRWR